MFNKNKSGYPPPEYRKPTPPPPPTSGSNAVKPTLPNTGSAILIPDKFCTYKTPCGWCTKWDKKCDEKPYKRGLRVKINPIDDAIGISDDTLITNKTCKSEEDHEWYCCGVSTAGSLYCCKKCGAHKTEPFTSSTSNGYQGE